jgi:2-polyprenyl-6-methoxyphenol hydroxylase-like FAD-dependent oxidoreductase
VRIVDKTAEPGKTSRALAVHARTLELYRQLDLADFVVEHGHKVPAVNLWVKGEPAARLPFATVGEDLTAYAFLEIFPQDQHERLLIERLEKLGVAVERRTELMRFADKGDRVIANFRGPDGHEEECEATYIAGCDGARSLVRETLGTGFAGGTYRHVFYVADVEAAGPSIDGELHVDFDEADLLAVFPLAGEGRARLIGTVRDERADHADTLKFGDVSSQAIDHLKVQVKKVNWFSTYHVHHRVTEHFRKDRAFLLGDAAHIHSPVGGQGMNTGIGDAVNLAWKLAAVLAGRAPDSLLDSYETERIGFAKRLVATTDRAFSLRHRRRAGRRNHPYAHRTGDLPEDRRVRAGTRLHLSNGLADHPQLSRNAAQRRLRRSRAWWRSASVGAERGRGQFRLPLGDDLAGSCLWHGEA